MRRPVRQARAKRSSLLLVVLVVPPAKTGCNPRAERGQHPVLNRTIQGGIHAGNTLLSSALAGAAVVGFMVQADAQVLVGGNDTKVWWDDAGKVLQRAPGKDTISIIDIGNRENPRILGNLELEIRSLDHRPMSPCIRAATSRWWPILSRKRRTERTGSPFPTIRSTSLI